MKEKIMILIPLLIGILSGSFITFQIGKCPNEPLKSNDALNDVINYSCKLEVENNKVVCELTNFSDLDVKIKNVTLKSSGEEKQEENTTVKINSILSKNNPYTVEFNQKDVNKITTMELTYEYEK